MIKLLSNGNGVETKSINSINHVLNTLCWFYEVNMNKAYSENKIFLAKRYEKKIDDIGKELESITQENPETWVF